MGFHEACDQNKIMDNRIFNMDETRFDHKNKTRKVIAVTG